MADPAAGDRPPMQAPPSRRETRERAVELLYEAEAKGVDPERVIEALPLPVDPYTAALAIGVADHVLEIDHVLERHATGWTVARMAAMDRMVLRLGTFELAARHDVPRGVCLAEAVELGATYGSTDETARFVNGLLEAVAREVRGTGEDAPTKPWMPIDCIVFDMDGVFRHWTGVRIAAFEREHGLPAGSIEQVAFRPDLLDDAMTGRTTSAEWAARIARELGSTFPDLDQTACAEMWLGTDWRVDDDMVALARQVTSAGTTTAVFSNATDRLEHDIGLMEIGDVFDTVANSAHIGHAKPAGASYDAVRVMLGIPAERLLFIDDRPENVVGALERGWHAVLMTDANRIGGVLARLGVPGAAAAA